MMEPGVSNVPAIDATIRAYVHQRLVRGEAPADVRKIAVSAFLDVFEAPEKSLAEQYRQEVGAAVEAAIRDFSPV